MTKRQKTYQQQAVHFYAQVMQMAMREDYLLQRLSPKQKNKLLSGAIAYSNERWALRRVAVLATIFPEYDPETRTFLRKSNPRSLDNDIR